MDMSGFCFACNAATMSGLMTQWWWPLGQPVTTRTVARIANVMSAGLIHFDCVTAMITLMSVLFIFITLFFFC